MALAALIALLSAAYLYWSPVLAPKSDGFPVDCGTAAAPPADELGQALCGQIVEQRAWQAAAAAALAIILVGGGIYVFGVSRKEVPGASGDDARPADGPASSSS